MSELEFKYRSITRNWGGGKKIQEEYDRKIDDWIAQFESGEKEILLELLKHYDFYTARKVLSRIEELFEKFTDETKENANEVVFIPPVYKEYGGVGFSDEFFNEFWIRNNIKESCEKNICDLLAMGGNNFDKIAIVDDYSGSGRTIEETIKKCIQVNDKVKQAIFYIITLQMSTKAFKRLMKYSEENEVSLTICSLRVVDKAFERNSVFDMYCVDRKKRMITLTYA